MSINWLIFRLIRGLYSNALISEIDPLSESTARPGILHRSARCVETCPAGPPGPPGEKGAKGDLGRINYPLRNAETGNGSKPGWCYLETQLLESFGYTYFLEKINSTSKEIVVIKASSAKSLYESFFLCKSVCGLLLKPNTLEENDEVNAILTRNGINTGLWIRITDKDEQKGGKQTSKEGIWRDTTNNQRVRFTNWAKGQPSAASSSYDYAYLYYPDGKWHDATLSSSFAHIVCELP